MTSSKNFPSNECSVLTELYSFPRHAYVLRSSCISCVQVIFKCVIKSKKKKLHKTTSFACNYRARTHTHMISSIFYVRMLYTLCIPHRNRYYFLVCCYCILFVASTQDTHTRATPKFS